MGIFRIQSNPKESLLGMYQISGKLPDLGVDLRKDYVTQKSRARFLGMASDPSIETGQGERQNPVKS